ncbi:cation-translocating P-type ATPase [Nocardia ignorata]|uniref:P-type E1-E2 ATPase n=1 Tax=Nocardia ignorata TaxID=145285 RepID=A0A4R6P2S3_NOCIG|nr:cation-transporting P-type ATPase [Nocardia ignorata]TDP31811.1 P-type E1-E2 ATPase [Nocardia ignorata]
MLLDPGAHEVAMTTVGYRGLTSAEAAVRHRRDGANALPATPPPNRISQFAGQLTHFFAAMLWIAAALALIAGMPALAIAIACVVILNGIFAFVQEYRADRAAQRLHDLLPVTAAVRRDGRVVTVDSDTLVIGDLLVLEAGDRVCADATMRTARRVAVDESMLTGEAEPVPRGIGELVLAGTYVVAGQGEAEVHGIGSATRLATLAAATARATRPPSPLTRQLHRVVRLVALIAVLVGVSSFGVFAALGRDLTESLLFSIGVTVALVPEGLLPTVTLSLARAAQRMAGQNALVRRLEAVETLGATTFICTDKTGTLTRNEMQVVEVWTPPGPVIVDGTGYSPDATLTGTAEAIAATATMADSAARCSPDARAQFVQAKWVPIGDPMEVAVHVLATRTGAAPPPVPWHRTPFDTHTRRASVIDADGEHITGAPEAILALCESDTEDATARVAEMTARGLRVLAVARAADPASTPRLLGVIGLEDPPRADVATAIADCRSAGIQVAMVTGDHPGTAAAIAEQVGLFGPDRLVLSGADLPEDDGRLASLLERGGVVVARVAPEQKLRIAAALQRRGHVVAMTGDGVNDGPALRAADIGIAMGASGTDVAREAADLVLLDDHFGTIVAAIRLGRATFANIRRFLTYHLTDNVAELAPFALWAASGGTIPLGFTVLQVLALDIGTDMLPALALGAEPPNPRTMSGPPKAGTLIDRTLLRRVFGVLGATEATVAMCAFLTVLTVAGWRLGDEVAAGTLASASGALFVAIVLGQLTNAFACRSETRWVGATGWRGNPLLLTTVAIEIALLVVFLWVPPLPELLGGSPPTVLGWVLAACAIPALLAADTAHKMLRRRRR